MQRLCQLVEQGVEPRHLILTRLTAPAMED
jgi:hypothetical protein